ncbi:hypothetical protein [Nonomuraea sp. NPDC049709]|uniref:hypothetical protein n=1 Tax=Nonomuraea sp. NPDC049709 TaxID=3154736 RepID=UPI0034432917
MAAYRLSTYVHLGDEQRLIDEGQAALNALAHETDHEKIAAVHADIAAAQLRIGNLNDGITSGHLALETAQRTESRWALHQRSRELPHRQARHFGARTTGRRPLGKPELGPVATEP